MLPLEHIALSLRMGVKGVGCGVKGCGGSHKMYRNGSKVHSNYVSQKFLTGYFKPCTMCLL